MHPSINDNRLEIICIRKVIVRGLDTIFCRTRKRGYCDSLWIVDGICFLLIPHSLMFCNFSLPILPPQVKVNTWTIYSHSWAELRLLSDFIIPLEADNMNAMSVELLTKTSTAVTQQGHSPLSCHSDSYRKEVESHLEWWLLDSSSAKTQLPFCLRIISSSPI